MQFSCVSKRFRAGACGAAAVMFLASSTAAAKQKPQPKKDDGVPYDQALDEYIRQAGLYSLPPDNTLGSLWNAGGRLGNLARDDKGAQVGDLVTINILESTTASASGTAKAARTFSASSGLNAFYGPIKSAAKLTNLFSPTSQNSLNGSATTASSHTLSTDLTGTVVKVLPNGYLVVQAARDVYIDNQRQHVIVRGVVRPSDLSPENNVASSAVANLQVEVEGKGVISDGTQPPNAVTRFILKVVGF
jgi:flagellar L-ring protein precursor FlgH